MARRTLSTGEFVGLTVGVLAAFASLGVTGWWLEPGLPYGDAFALGQIGAAAVVLLGGAAGLTLLALRQWTAAALLILIAVLATAGVYALIALKPKPVPPPTSALLLPGVKPWPGGIVPICWLNRPDRPSASTDDLRMILAVKQAEETWSAAGAVSFKDVGTCPTGDFHGARLLIGRTIGDAEAPALGAAVGDQVLPVGVPFTFPSRGGCSTNGAFKGADACAYGEAVHELGHVLGLPDIHYSQAAPPDCKATLRGDHPWLNIPYDPNSVMNACNPNHLFGQPSAGDLAAVRTIYGTARF